MEHNGYEVTPYQSEFKTQVADLMQYLWGGDSASNLAHFKWKYEDNPHTSGPLGIVALQGEQVVGFRGYFAARFELSGRNDNIVLLRPGDTCVHPEHRRTGLSVAMGNLAMQEYADQHPLFLNLSCTRSSLPGYRRMGFLALAPKASVARYSLFGLARYILAPKEQLPWAVGDFAFGRSVAVLVSDSPRPEEMAALIAAQTRQDARLRPHQDAAFFRWRYRNPRQKYLFYYLMQDGGLSGYLVLGLSPNNRRGYILDYEGEGGSALRQILVHIIKGKKFDVLSIPSYGVDAALGPVLKAVGFRSKSLVRIIERRLHGELPVLVRPVKKDFAEDDLFVEGVDVRRIENWALKPICSDAV
jgi:GNAT superfamily N-acetyltransferase